MFLALRGFLLSFYKCLTAFNLHGFVVIEGRKESSTKEAEIELRYVYLWPNLFTLKGSSKKKQARKVVPVTYHLYFGSKQYKYMKIKFRFNLVLFKDLHLSLIENSLVHVTIYSDNTSLTRLNLTLILSG